MLEPGQCLQPVGRTGMARNEHHIALDRAGGAPAKIMLGAEWLTVVVDAEKTNVEVEARILEVVGVAAEESDVVLRGHHEANIGELPVLIEVILPALVERDDLTAQLGPGGGFL